MKRHFLAPGIATVSAVLILSGCSDPGFRGVNGVKIASANEVASCRMIETIDVKPGVYGPVLGGQGLKYSRNKALDMAGKDGANTVVFSDDIAGTEVTNITARAYAC
ncbi:hypothetical protein [Paenirhodobacter enshiensis]|uniref:Lipoprotein n=1 Tax=Paenirhodobacter enshiensis TaxID=1105367 RepID=A0A086Y1U0_9RHOB|nr:hypothetical protein [Paenirhodobacter enshiensis]KFI28240.1 hypothetical protein CG50_15260 [Paenirhodobacter enshiensis]